MEGRGTLREPHGGGREPTLSLHGWLDGAVAGAHMGGHPAILPALAGGEAQGQGVPWLPNLANDQRGLTDSAEPWPATRVRGHGRGL